MRALLSSLIRILPGIYAFQRLRLELAAAIRVHIGKYELGSLETQALICCETAPEKKKKGLLGRLFGGDSDAIHYTGMLITPAWLIWVRSSAKTGAVVAWARPSEIEVERLPLLLDQLPASQAAAFALGFCGWVEHFWHDPPVA